MALAMSFQSLVFCFIIINSIVVKNLLVNCSQVYSVKSIKDYIKKIYPNHRHLSDTQVRYVLKLMQEKQQLKHHQVLLKKDLTTASIPSDFSVQNEKWEKINHHELHKKLTSVSESSTSVPTPHIHLSPIWKSNNQNETLLNPEPSASNKIPVQRKDQPRFETDSRRRTTFQFWRHFNSSGHRNDFSEGLPFWVGVCLGAAATTLTLLLILSVRKIVIHHRGRKNDLKELSFDSNLAKKQPVLLRLSQMHGAKPGSQYVVSVMDESKFSINDVSSDSEEELFDMSDIKPYHSPIKPCSSPLKSLGSFHSANKTSTPIKLRPPTM